MSAQEPYPVEYQQYSGLSIADLQRRLVHRERENIALRAEKRGRTQQLKELTAAIQQWRRRYWQMTVRYRDLWKVYEELSGVSWKDVDAAMRARKEQR